MLFRSGGKMTIGYGTLIDTVNEKWLLSAVIDKATGEELLKTDLKPIEKFLNANCEKNLNQSQFDSLVCFIYNIGIGAFRKSTLFRYVNSDPNSPQIHNQFLKWIFVAGVESRGLYNRRMAESKLYYS